MIRETIGNEDRERAACRYVVQLLTPSKLLAQMSGRDTVVKSDVEEVR